MELLESPAKHVKRLPVDNVQTRILTEDEQRRLPDVIADVFASYQRAAIAS